MSYSRKTPMYGLIISPASFILLILLIHAQTLIITPASFITLNRPWGHKTHLDTNYIISINTCGVGRVISHASGGVGEASRLINSIVCAGTCVSLLLRCFLIFIVA